MEIKLGTLITPNKMPKQATIKKSVSLDGLGLHTGEIASLTFLPAEPDTGVIFRRVDLPGKPEIPANVSSVIDTQRSTTIGISKEERISTVEHLLATLYCLSIDNIIIECNAPETPLLDGSSKFFIETILSAGRIEQNSEQKFLEIKKPIAVDSNGMTLIALPAPEFKISYTLSYSNPLLGNQFQSFEINQENFINEIGNARTFALYSELEHLLKMGLIKGGSLDNAIVITNEAVLSKEGLRFPDEFVRHKIVDLIGDLYLTGCRLKAHVISIRSGHTYNVKLANAICDAYNI